MKRFFDLAVVIVSAPLWVPMMMLIALSVLVADGRPVIFRDRRAGKDGKSFTMFKFRTMTVGDGPDAERLTAFGRWLRKTALDELPELWNVMKGEMSLVGPRPLPVRYLERYTPEEMRRHEVLPGMTGWAQVHGRNAIDWEEKFRYDLDYVDNHSLWLDLKIMLLTVGELFRTQDVNHAGETTMGEFRGAK